MKHHNIIPEDQTNPPDLSALIESWYSPFVERQHVGRFSGGILHPRTMANLDASGQGPEGRVKIGNKVAYPVTQLVAWMENRASAMD